MLYIYGNAIPGKKTEQTEQKRKYQLFSIRLHTTDETIQSKMGPTVGVAQRVERSAHK